MRAAGLGRNYREPLRPKQQLGDNRRRAVFPASRGDPVEVFAQPFRAIQQPVFAFEDVGEQGSVVAGSVRMDQAKPYRNTAAIRLSSKSGDFTGRCQKSDPAKAERAF